ncbi:uncharacterized protein LOC141611751 [Silene latifolia]|uniref:uncharacterized protein LOC141611751 n=1 Tax=Silene latifolia TaxID=37657 RepID=UPI003D7813E8
MGKKVIEICLISARGLPRPRLWKQHWYAVGWVDPSDKYCTKIDVSGKPNPVWKTKFTTVVDWEVQELSLNVEVYSREPVFLKEKLQGIASINLREFLVKYSRNVEGSSKEGNEDVGSFQLRAKKSNKPQGFIDVSVRISDVKTEGSSSYSTIGDEEGFNLQNGSGITLATCPIQAYPGRGKAEPPFNPNNHWDPYIGMPGYPAGNVPHYPSPGMPPPPPPPHPSTNGYVPQANTQSTSYINMPSSSGVGRGVGPAFGVGMGAGALAAGAVMFGGDFMSGFELPTVMPNPSLTISIDPPF